MIRCEQLTRKYGRMVAVDSLNLQIGAGEIHGFVGPNGAGKTTTMKILATLMKPTSGDAFVDGVSVSRQPKQARRLVGYMPDFFGVYDNLKSWEYLDFYAGCVGIDARERRKRIDELLELTALSDKREAYVDHLSRGMKQRLCLARALLHDPKLLILDEPASGMDPRSRAQMRDILSEVGRMGKTVLISSHILPELAQLCSHVTILERGKPAFSGSITELENKMNAAHALIIRFAEPLTEEMHERIAVAARRVLNAEPEKGKESEWLINCAENPEKDKRLLLELIEQGIPVCSYHRERATLESVFMEVTKHEAESNR